jgi:hypothetical protein
MNTTFKIRPEIPLIVAILWTCTIQHLAMPVPQVITNTLVLGLCALMIIIYRTSSIPVQVDTVDFRALAAIIAFNVVVHWGGLLYSLGGDELYHADRAIPLAAIYRDLFPFLTRTSIESFRSSMWHLLDPRHVNVLDLWRTISFCLVFGALGTVLFTRALKSKNFQRHGRAWRIAFLSILGTLAIVLGYWIDAAPEVHAPARLLPLLLSNIVFGYNPFAFRIPGLLALSFIQWLLLRYLWERASLQPLWWHLVICLSIGFIPVVFYSAEAVEPSIYGFCTFMLVMLFAHKYLEDQRLEHLILAAVAAAVGTLCRQSSVLTWGLVFLAFVCRPRNWHWRPVLLVFTPFLIDVPYLYSVSRLAHPAVQGGFGSKSDLLNQALSSGVAIMSVVNTTTVPWMLICFAAVLIWMRVMRWTEVVPLLLVFPAWFLFYTIWPYLWGLGRYQAEYVAPFGALLLVFSCIHVARSYMKYACLVLAIGMISTLEVNSNLSLDINYAQWPRMRITSSASFPYREALGTLKRAEVGGNFAIIGGSPIYNRSVLWLAGFSFWETARWEHVQGSLASFLSQPRNPAEVRAFVQANGIQAVVVQSGTRREIQHREGMPGIAAFITSIEKVPLESKSYFYKQASFGGEHGGILTIYKPRD